MFRIGVVTAIPLVLGLVGGPLMIAWGSPEPATLNAHLLAAALGAGLGLLAAAGNLLGALIVNKIGLKSRAVNTVLFAGIAIATFGFLSDWIDTMLRVVGGIDLLGERTMLWLFFLLNLILCCGVHRGPFLPKKVRTVS